MNNSKMIKTIRDTTVTTYEDDSIETTLHFTKKGLTNLQEGIGFIEEQQKLNGGHIKYMHYSKEYRPATQPDAEDTYSINFDLVIQG